METTLALAWPPEAWQDVTVLVAVSGGADSVALLRAMHALKQGGEGRLLAVHANHHLRGDESEGDEAFVRRLCEQLAVPCEVGHLNLPPGQQETSDVGEQVARNARYDFFQQVAARRGARYVTTAHTADDQAETILHRVVRGTGIGGLRGMDRARPLGPAATLIRPLLGVRRAELTAYLQDLGQSCRTDSSNAERRFTRNRIRHDLLPRLAEQFNPEVVDALLRLGALAGEVQAVIAAIVEDLSEQCVVSDAAGGVEIAVGPLTDQPPYVVRELLMAVWRRQGWPMQSMGFAQWDLLAETIDAAATDTVGRCLKRVVPGNVAVEPQPGCLRLRRINQ